MWYELYPDSAGYWRWTLWSENNRKIADSAEGYVNEQGAQHGITLVKGSANAPVRKRTR